MKLSLGETWCPTAGAGEPLDPTPGRPSPTKGRAFLPCTSMSGRQRVGFHAAALTLGCEGEEGCYDPENPERRKPGHSCQASAAPAPPAHRSTLRRQPDRVDCRNPQATAVRIAVVIRLGRICYDPENPQSPAWVPGFG